MSEVIEKVCCYHCGDPCEKSKIELDDKAFCCTGCLNVFQLLNNSGLCSYYELNESPGLSPEDEVLFEKYSHLQDSSVAKLFTQYRDDNLMIIRFHVPSIHCSSCIWLLENLDQIDSRILESKVNFTAKEVEVKAIPDKINPKDIAVLMAKTGYAPDISLENDKSSTSGSKDQKKLIFKLALAGFCFGNIMLLSFPEYLTGENIDSAFKNVFRYLSLGLSLPVLFYSGNDYFKSALSSLRVKKINIDVPIALGIVSLFGISVYQIFSDTGSGYSDSLAGLIFFLLIGKFFQEKTYGALSFEKDYTAYFPLAVTRVFNEKEESILLKEIKRGDILKIRHGETIPADGILTKGNAYVDYSFITGESLPVLKSENDILYAGGKQLRESIYLTVISDVKSSQLARLWDKDGVNDSTKNQFKSLTDHISKYFTYIILAIATFSLVYWLFKDPSKAAFAFTSVLIVACPCALALSVPFTYGTIMRIMGKNKFYLKNSAVIDRLRKVNNLVFDKTGTLTLGQSKIAYQGKALTEEDQDALYELCSHSIHPVAQSIKTSLNKENTLSVSQFEELSGLGLSGIIQGRKYQLGKASWLSNDSNKKGTLLYIDNTYYGSFQFENLYRGAINKTLASLKGEYKLHVISGDNDSERKNLRNLIGANNSIHFNQSPEDKLGYIAELQKNEGDSAMIGDGLNDAGALKAASVGISLQEKNTNFSPASDAILKAEALGKFPGFLKLAKRSRSIVIISFVLSFLYNIIGLSFAVSGNLSPVIAAILMPLSSITIVAFTVLSSNFYGSKYIE